MAAGVGTDLERRTAMLAAALAAAVVIGGCDANPSPPASTLPASAGPTADAADRLVVAVTPVVADWSPVITTPFLSMSNLFLPPELPALPRFIHSSLYRYDDTLSPVPDLASEPCTVGDDDVTITCRLADATFHDGSAVTAADVVFSFELARHSGCSFTGYLVCLDTLERVNALDERTVEFTLNTPDATFLTLALPLVMIESQAVVEAQYAPLADAELDRPAIDAVLEDIATAVDGGDAACGPVVAEADGLLEGLGVGVPSHDFFDRIDEGGGFDACAALQFARYRIEHVLASDEAEGPEAIAAAYGALPLNWEPIGAGPWRIRERIGGDGLLLEAAPGHHLGPAATREIELRLFPANESAAEAMAAGDVDWIPNQFVGLEAVEGVEGARILTYEAPAFAHLAFNLREGRLFADPNIRAALEHCIDKPATVDAATEGGGTAIFSPIEPISWAYRDDLPRVERDVAEAKRLIEESGWKMGADGTYQRDGRRLATDVFVTDFDAPRRFMDLVAEQARDCGIELTVVPADSATVLEPLNTFPHVPGGYGEPFDAVFLGWIHGWDPSDILFDSRFASSEEQPDGVNVMGYRNPRIDALLDAGIATYDQRERARIYREYQTILAEDRPVLFAWAFRLRDAITAGVRLADGSQINERSGYWWWRLEELMVASDPT